MNNKTSAKSIRQQFLTFFESKNHKIVPSAPVVLKDDPTLLFVNAGMNQFKDFFLGNQISKDPRIADTQKCLRVSGKHNDLEEVGVDTYHHTLFEMLGNWSFGDYFKEESIAWAWELLTEVYKIDKDRLYVSVFSGDEADGLEMDNEAKEIWKNYIDESRILEFDRKDNFWEMGDTGPCGPCSEIHVDLRSDEERAKVGGASLVNMDHEQVIEIWNLVFIQFNRKADGSLETLPNKNVDTGMGFERLVRAVQMKKSNYDTDIFTPYIIALEKLSGKKYGETTNVNIAFRVIADHIRAVSFAIADGQLPSNTGAGYVIRRILRRAVRYGYTFLGFEKAFFFELVNVLVNEMGEVFPEIVKQKDFLIKVIKEEENSFFNTLSKGISILDSHCNTFDLLYLENNQIVNKEKVIVKEVNYRSKFSIRRKLLESLTNDSLKKDDNVNISINDKGQIELTKDSLSPISIQHFKNVEYDYRQVIIPHSFKNILLEKRENKLLDGKTAFELFDTYGFPLDLTQLIASENNLLVDVEGYNLEMQKQKERSRNAEESSQGDWVEVYKDEKEEFVGYDLLETSLRITRYREVEKKNAKLVHLVFNTTPFYAESGGQVGDSGYIEDSEGNKTYILDTQKENNLTIHIVKQSPANVKSVFKAFVNTEKRKDTEKNHSATHLLQNVLRSKIGDHVEQRGSLVNENYLRFDFSHFQKLTEEEIIAIEKAVNEKIRENIVLEEKRELPLSAAKELGAMALFGEKYGDVVRVIKFDDSIEFCGGTHVAATGEIGLFKIISESSIASGVRRIEALTGKKALEYFNGKEKELDNIQELLKAPSKTIEAVQKLIDENAVLNKKLEAISILKEKQVKELLLSKVRETQHGINVVIKQVDLDSAESLKNITFQMNNEFQDLFLVLGTIIDGKPLLSVSLGEKPMKTYELHAGKIIKEIAKEINGGGGGQDFYATAGGKNVDGIYKALTIAEEMISNLPIQ